MEAYWIWYPGDFEIHQGMVQNFQREERGMGWPAYWYMDDNYHNVVFKRSYNLTEETSFLVVAQGEGYVDVNGTKYPFDKEIDCIPGKTIIEIHVGKLDGLPCIYINSDIVKTNKDWVVSNFLTEKPVGYSQLFFKAKQDPNKLYYAKKRCVPQSVTELKDGVLYDFKRAINGQVEINFLDTKLEKVNVYYGESKSEALACDNSYYQQREVIAQSKLRKRAFRYIFISNIKKNQVQITAYHEFLPKDKVSSFVSDNKLINKIWQVAQTTFDLCSDWFFIDGIKRDRWIWAGDTYQTNFINQYTTFDEDVDKRTILALRGHQTIKQHINTIVDYSMLWVISVLNHYQMTGDITFLQEIYSSMETMVRYLMQQTNELGFIYGRKKDWIFVDWAEIDKKGTTAAEQLYLLKVYQSVITVGKAIGKDISEYEQAYEMLRKNTLNYFWSDSKGCFIDSYISKKEHVSRHPNILAVIFNLVGKDKQKQILNNVLLNSEIPQITTPYFKFFEQDALCILEQYDYVFKSIQEYWGAMLANDAVTFWEEFTPDKKGDARYEMYGDPFGKSLCHAWGASPIYLLGRYIFGVKPTKPGYRSFEIKPYLKMFTEIKVTLPIKKGFVKISKQNGELKVLTNKNGGLLVID